MAERTGGAFPRPELPGRAPWYPWRLIRRIATPFMPAHHTWHGRQPTAALLGVAFAGEWKRTLTYSRSRWIRTSRNGCSRGRAAAFIAVSTVEAHGPISTGQWARHFEHTSSPGLPAVPMSCLPEPAEACFSRRTEEPRGARSRHELRGRSPSTLPFHAAC